MKSLSQSKSLGLKFNSLKKRGINLSNQKKTRLIETKSISEQEAIQESLYEDQDRLKTVKLDQLMGINR